MIFSRLPRLVAKGLADAWLGARDMVVWWCGSPIDSKLLSLVLEWDCDFRSDPTDQTDQSWPNGR